MADVKRAAATTIAAGVLLVATGCGSDAPAKTKLAVDWAGSEGHPACRYDAASRTVEATLTIDGTAKTGTKVVLTVTAYADENTSDPVGSSTRTVQVAGTVHQSVAVTIPVTEVPHLDDDGITACKRTVSS